jgi:antagonist of KipI
MGSRSTFVRAGTGGWKGRSLQKGDVIPFQQLVRSRILAEEINPLKRTFVTARWTSHPALLPVYEKDPVVRIIKGPEYELFTEESKHYLWKSSFRISPQSDRMGYRLQGNSLRMETSAEMLSTAVTFGTIQVPANGNPIILMADHQTIGGYPRIGQVASADFSRLAQAPPGSWISFKEISIKEAQQLYIQQEKYMKLLKSAVNLKVRGSMLQ